MTVYHAAVVLQPVSGITADRATWNFHFHGEALSPLTDAAIIIAHLEQFVEGLQVTDPIGEYVSGTMSRAVGATRIKVWTVNVVDLVETFILEGSATLGPANAVQNCVDEAAVCMSYHGALEGSAVDRRKRGRIYLGPLTRGAVTNATGTVPARPTTAFIDDINSAALELQDLGQTTGVPWIVWSPTYKEEFDVVGGWVDNAADTQRRRGVSATSRTIWAAP